MSKALLILANYYKHFLCFPLPQGLIEQTGNDWVKTVHKSNVLYEQLTYLFWGGIFVRKYTWLAADTNNVLSEGQHVWRVAHSN